VNLHKTDFADEAIKKEHSQDYTIKRKEYGSVSMTHIEILKKNKMIQKDVGNYISIDFKTLQDEKDRINISDVLLKTLHNMATIKKLHMVIRIAKRIFLRKTQMVMILY